MIKTIIGEVDFLESLRGKSATFILSMASTKTANIDGITQAGIKGLMHLTPILDAEFLCTGAVRSLSNIAETPKGVPTPALITRAVHLLKPYRNIELLNLGVCHTPKVSYFKTYSFELNESGSIDTGAKIDSESVFKKGLDFGQNLNLDSDYLLLAESIPAGTTTAYATAKILGYDADGKFSSSYKDAPAGIKKDIVEKALQNANGAQDIFEKLGCVGDNMLIFNAGLILGAIDKNIKIVLCGGTQMAAVLLIVNSILQEMGGEISSSNLALFTTKWVATDSNSDIKALLEMLDFKINAYYADFDFSTSNHPALKLYDSGEAKEGVGAGGALCYAFLNGVKKADIIEQIESFLKQ